MEEKEMMTTVINEDQEIDRNEMIDQVRQEMEADDSEAAESGNAGGGVAKFVLAGVALGAAGVKLAEHFWWKHKAKKAERESAVDVEFEDDCDFEDEDEPEDEDGESVVDEDSKKSEK